MTLVGILPFFKNSVNADQCRGKIDAGPAYLHIDILESGHTVKKLDMIGFKADGAVLITNGLYLKPNVLFGGGQGQGTLFSGSLGLVQCVPFKERWLFSPGAGFTFTNLTTTTNIPALDLHHLRERFRSIAPYLSLEATFKICQGLRISAAIQYSWSRTHTKIAHLFKSKSHSKGPNYGLLLERDFNDEWSINLGFGYNISLSKEKHGLRGYGAKIGIVRWF